METVKMPEAIDQHRRHFFGTAAATVAAAQLGMIGSAAAQSGATKAARLPAIKPGAVAGTLVAQGYTFCNTVPAGVQYAYAVKAVDKAGNASAPSAPVVESAR